MSDESLLRIENATYGVSDKTLTEYALVRRLPDNGTLCLELRFYHVQWTSRYASDKTARCPSCEREPFFEPMKPGRFHEKLTDRGGCSLFQYHYFAPPARGARSMDFLLASLEMKSIIVQTSRDQINKGGIRVGMSRTINFRLCPVSINYYFNCMEQAWEAPYKVYPPKFQIFALKGAICRHMSVKYSFSQLFLSSQKFRR